MHAGIARNGPIPVIEPIDLIVKVRGISKSYGNIEALRGIDLDFPRGKLTSLLGPSGCGKTTLLKIIAGLIEADGGTVTVEGKTVTRPGPERAFVFQDFALMPWATVMRNVAFGMELSGTRRAEREDIARHYIAEVGLAGFEDKYPHELSGGMRQRVGLARALSVKADVLLNNLRDRDGPGRGTGGAVQGGQARPEAQEGADQAGGAGRRQAPQRPRHQQASDPEGCRSLQGPPGPARHAGTLTITTAKATWEFQVAFAVVMGLFTRVRGGAYIRTRRVDIARSCSPRWSWSKITAGITRHSSTVRTTAAKRPGADPSGFRTAIPIIRWPML